MSSNFLNRIITSIILSFILFACIFLSKLLWIYLLILVSFISFYEITNLSSKIFKKQKTKKLIFNLFSILYLFIFIYVGYILSNSSSLNLLFILLICIFSDTGGYLVGKFIGGKKLTKISPNKTVSGSIGSFIFSIIPIFIFLEFIKTDIDFIFQIENINENLFPLILFCLFLSFICQLGDLFISYLKRLAKIKNTGSILPGHGGLLDRIDGLIFVLPTAFIMDKLII